MAKRRAKGLVTVRSHNRYSWNRTVWISSYKRRRPRR